MFYHGEFSAMNPRQELFGGEIVIIRPLCYVEDDVIRKFAKESKFPSQLCKCPNAQVSKRRMMKEFIKGVQKDCAYAKLNLFRSIGRVNKEYTQIREMDNKINMWKEVNFNGTEGREGRHKEEKGLPLLRR
jgi:tRNA 2-thiocytidine biosynthesis protein TtcA